MKRLIIIGEGQTEQEFCKNVLQKDFLAKGIFVQSPTIKKSRGGMVKWSVLKKQIDNHLKNEPEAFVTTFIDLYGINEKHSFPGWFESQNIVDIQERISFLENKMSESIDTTMRFRFIPYIQLHEFEGLLFTDQKVFDNNFEPEEFNEYAELIDTINNYPNPELINDGHLTAPSKRLKRLIKGYNKIVYGSFLAEEIGLLKLREKNPRFNAWINKLENV